MVEDINDSFRLEAAALPLRRQPISPGELLWTAAREQAGPSRRAPRVRYSADLPELPADGRLLQRVLRNLIGNAYKHAGPQADVVLSAQLGDGRLCFAVEDDGPGISPEERERVFARFVQGAGDRPGSGLGLAFCKLVVEQHGGQIWVESVASGGTRVCFALPVSPTISAPVHHSAAA